MAARLLAALGAHPSLAKRVSQIDVSDPRDLMVILKGDTAMVRLGDEQFAERLQSYVDLSPVLREKVPEIDYVDLRFDERVYVRPQSRGSLKASAYRTQVKGQRSWPGTNRGSRRPSGLREGED